MAAPPRDAATVILARPVPGGAYEVLMIRRPKSMRFMGGMYVFPGGAVDPEDCAPEMEALSAIAPAEAARRLSEDLPPERALGLYCCAVRELFEEVGILLARDASGRDVDPQRVRDRWARGRAARAQRAADFAAFLRAEGLVLATDRLRWHARLVTPAASPIRFDARFFVAPAPPGQEVVLEGGEVEDAIWIAPARALEAAAAGRMAVPIPTMAMLQGLSEVPGYEQLLGGVRPSTKIDVAELSPLVARVLAPNPGLATGAGTNTYVVGVGETVIVDPAVPHGTYIERVVRRAAERGRLRLVLLTHLHPDHIGGAEVLASQTGCEVGAWEGVAERTPYVTRPLRDGEVLRVGGATLRILHTPGHASDHVCFFLEEERALFSGDVVAGEGTVVIAPPDGNMEQYLASLERLVALQPARIYPGHGPVVEDGVGKLRAYLAHRRLREAQVLEALRGGATEPAEIVRRVYTDVPEALHPMAELSVLAHLEMLQRAGRAVRGPDGWRPSP